MFKPNTHINPGTARRRREKRAGQGWGGEALHGVINEEEKGRGGWTEGEGLGENTDLETSGQAQHGVTAGCKAQRAFRMVSVADPT